MYDDKDFDRNFRNTQRAVVTGMVISGIVSGGVVLFAVWVIIKLLSHFGVI